MGRGAITLDAPPAQIWPWLVQMGLTRAGWHSHGLLDNLGRRRARRVIPELADLEPGTIVPMSPDGTPETGCTRLITRVRSRYQWSSPSIAFSLLLEFGDVWMMRKMLLNLHERLAPAA